MNKRLLTAAIGIALCALTAPANARTRMNDDDDGGRSYRQRQYDRSYDRDDDDDEQYPPTQSSFAVHDPSAARTNSLTGSAGTPVPTTTRQ